MQRCGRTPAPATGAVLPGLLSSVWLSLNSLPAFETIHSPAERASWQHLLLANVFDKFWIDTPKHLEQVGFDLAAAGGQGDDDPILMERSTGPTDVKLPFFHLLEDRSVRESCRCSLHEPKYPSHSSGSGPASAAALHFLDRLSQVSISDEEAEDGFRSPPPPPVVLVKFVDQFVAIMVATQTSEGKSDVSLLKPASTLDRREAHCLLITKPQKSQRNCTVWRGDMTCLKDVTELTVILNNVATWATTTLRTALSEFVSAWMDRLPPEEPDQDDASDDDDEQGPKEESDVKHCDVEVITAQMGKLRIARTNSGLVQGIQQEQKKQQEDQQQQQQKPRKVDNAALVMSKDGTHKIVVRLPPPNPRDSPPARTAADAALETGGPSAAAAEGRPESSASGASGAAVSAMDASSPASIYSPLPTVFVGLSTATSSPQAALQPPVSIFTTTQSSSPSAADVDFTPAAPTSPGKGGDGKNHLLLAQPRPLTRPRGVSMGSAGVDGAATAAAAASAAAATLSSLQSRAVSDSGDHHYSIVTASQEEGGGGVFVDLPAKRAKIQQRPASFDGRAFDQARWFGGPDGTPHGWDVNSGGHFVVPLNSLGTLKRFRGPQDFDGEVFRFSVEVKAE